MNFTEMKRFGRYVLICLVLFVHCRAIAQETTRTFQRIFESKASKAEIELGGNIDFENTLVLHPWPRAFTAYSNLRQLSIQNLSDTVLINPNFSINGKRMWLGPSEIEQDILHEDFDLRSLLLWRRFVEHTYHKPYPFDGFRAGTPVELLTTFGYGICYNLSAAMVRMPSNETDIFHDLILYKHTVSEYQNGVRSALVDTDLRSFYVDLLDTRLASKAEIAHDRYLIKRTHHYGIQYSYDPIVNEYVAYLYSDKPSNNPTSTILPADFSLNYRLVPGETLVFDYMPANYFFSESPSSMYLDEVGNGYYTYDWRDSGNDYYIVNGNQVNVVQDEGRLVTQGPQSTGQFSFRLKHGFQMVFLELFADIDGEFESSDIKPEISFDSVTWISPFASQLNDSRLQWQFDLQRVSFPGEAIVRITVDSGNPDLAITNFGYVSRFQVSRLALPQMQRGPNTISLHYENPDDLPVGVNLSFSEKNGDVPATVQRPIFPSNGAELYGPVRKFEWESVSDDVVNYEFLLTADTLHGLPLAPNFHMYVNGSNYSDLMDFLTSGRAVFPSRMNPAAYKRSRLPAGNAMREKTTPLNSFEVYEEGFFRSGETYYWKVRPLHASGVWGSWSPYFSFTNIKVMPPINVQATDSILSWSAPKVGVTPVSFEVHASNEYMGFEPNDSTLLTATMDTTINITDQQFAFFRVISVDSLGHKSEVSPYVSRPYPFLKRRPDKVSPQVRFVYPVEFTAAFHPEVSPDDRYIENTDDIRFNILSMPSWLQYNYTTGAVEGLPTEETLKREYYSATNKIEFEFISGMIKDSRRSTLVLEYSITNNKPAFVQSDTAIYTNNTFQVVVRYADADVVFGDSVAVHLLEAPEWMSVEYGNKSVFLVGKSPDEEGFFNAKLVGIDKAGDSTIAEVGIQVITNQISFETVASSREVVDIALANLVDVETIFGSDANVEVRQSNNTREIVVEDNKLIVYDDYCEAEYPISIDVPMTISLPDSYTLDIDVFITISEKIPIPLTAYQPSDCDLVWITNIDCQPTLFQYRIMTTTGQLILQRESSLAPDESEAVYLDGMAAGLYLFEVKQEFGQRQVFRFLKQ